MPAKLFDFPFQDSNANNSFVISVKTKVLLGPEKASPLTYLFSKNFLTPPLLLSPPAYYILNFSRRNLQKFGTFVELPI